MVCVWIDELTPCLKSTKTGELVKTEVVRIKRKSFLKKYNKKTGWAINWEKQLNSNEVYALVLEGTVDIQGLISLSVDKDSKAVYIDWMCTNPQLISQGANDFSHLGEWRFLLAYFYKKYESFELEYCIHI